MIPCTTFQKLLKTYNSGIKHDKLRKLCKKMMKAASGRCFVKSVFLVADRVVRSRYT